MNQLANYDYIINIHGSLKLHVFLLYMNRF